VAGGACPGVAVNPKEIKPTCEMEIMKCKQGMPR
jgi:hypothetical protein